MVLIWEEILPLHLRHDSAAMKVSEAAAYGLIFVRVEPLFKPRFQKPAWEEHKANVRFLFWVRKRRVTVGEHTTTSVCGEEEEVCVERCRNKSLAIGFSRGEEISLEGNLRTCSTSRKKKCTARKLEEWLTYSLGCFLCCVWLCQWEIEVEKEKGRTQVSFAVTDKPNVMI